MFQTQHQSNARRYADSNSYLHEPFLAGMPADQAVGRPQNDGQGIIRSESTFRDNLDGHFNVPGTHISHGTPPDVVEIANTISKQLTDTSKPKKSLEPQSRKVIASNSTVRVDTKSAKNKPKSVRKTKTKTPEDAMMDSTPDGSKTPDQLRAKGTVFVSQPPPPLQSTGMYFSSLAEARRGVEGLNWGPQSDDSLPVDDADRQVLVQELVAAMKDMSAFQDKKGKVFTKRWLAEDEEATKAGNDMGGEEQGTKATAAQRVQFYAPHEMEKVCWEAIASTSVLGTPHVETNSEPGHLRVYLH